MLLRAVLCLVGMLLLTVPAHVSVAGEEAPASNADAASKTSQDIQDFISGVTKAFDENPHSCYEPDPEEDRPDLATRPQS